MQNFYEYDGDLIKILNVCTPEDFGAVGDGVADDAGSIQRCINQKGYILFAPNKTYRLCERIRIKGDTTLDLNGSTIIGEGVPNLILNFDDYATTSGYNGESNIIIKNGTIKGGCLSFAHAHDIRLENVSFKDCINDHFLEICACKNYIIDSCSFVGMIDTQISVYEYINIDPCYFIPFPWNDRNNTSFYDGTVNDGIFIRNCIFAIGEGDYAFGYNAIGVHVSDGNKHQNIHVENTKMTGFTGCGLRLNNMNNVVIRNNIIENRSSGADGIRIGDVANSTNVIIKGNVITASGTAIRKSSGSTVFQASDNDINPTFA